LIDCLDGQREQRKAGGRSGIRGGAAVQRKERGRGRKGKLTSGSQPSAAQRKRKGEGEDGLTREAGWAAWAERAGLV
jgi:hypothetical protein